MRWLLLGAIVTVSCASNGPLQGVGEGAAPQTEEAEIRFEVIVDETNSGVSDPLRQVVQDRESWEALWARVYAHVQPRPPCPEIDFSRDTLVAVAMGDRRSGGYAIRVQRVSRRGDAIDVTVLSSCPPRDAMVSGALTQPVQVVRLTTTARRPTFHETASESCD